MSLYNLFLNIFLIFETKNLIIVKERVKMKFKEKELTEETKKALEDIGYLEMTEIQEKAIPVILEGKDCIGQSKTGTGKTASYALPIIEMIDSQDKDVQAIVLCPTRELAKQVANEFRNFMKYKESIKTVCVYGGQRIDSQIKDIKKGAQIIIGTPGRVMDHIRRKTLKLQNTKIVVLDEADEMLNMGFEEDMETILKELNDDRQTILFSATMSPRIMKITKKYLKDPVNIKIKAKELTVDNIKQIAYEIKSPMKEEATERLLEKYNPQKTLIFCNTKRKVDNLIEKLQRKGYLVDAIHGDKSQDQRERIMKKFKSGDLKVLIATDVVARGIDVENLDLVINFDVPQEEEYYVHRIGRTGRNGKKGIALTFVVGKEKIKLSNIEKYAKTKIKYEKIPTISEINEIKSKKLLKKIQKSIDNIENEKNANIQMEKELFKKLMEQNENNSKKVAEALFKIVLNNNFKEKKEKPPMEKIKIGKNSIDKDGNVKLFLNLGKKDRLMSKDIVGSIAGNTAISGKDIGAIKILDNYSFVSIPPELVDELMKSMKDKQIKGKDARFEITKNKKD